MDRHSDLLGEVNVSLIFGNVLRLLPIFQCKTFVFFDLNEKLLEGGLIIHRERDRRRPRGQ